MELPGHPPQPTGEIPAAAQGDPEAHAQRPPGPAAPGRGGEENQRLDTVQLCPAGHLTVRLR